MVRKGRVLISHDKYQLGVWASILKLLYFEVRSLICIDWGSWKRDVNLFKASLLSSSAWPPNPSIVWFRFGDVRSPTMMRAKSWVMWGHQTLMCDQLCWTMCTKNWQIDIKRKEGCGGVIVIESNFYWLKKMHFKDM